VVGLDVAGRDDDAGVDGCRAAFHRRRNRDRSGSLCGRDLDPPLLPVGERLVGAQLEPEHADVELERAILVGGRDGHPAAREDVENGRRVPF
jgi:hypothetical protein